MGSDGRVGRRRWSAYDCWTDDDEFSGFVWRRRASCSDGFYGWSGRVDGEC